MTRLKARLKNLNPDNITLFIGLLFLAYYFFGLR